jgi:hypothetical protein
MDLSTEMRHDRLGTDFDLGKALLWLEPVTPS